jgi:hypothetical protein
MITLVCLGSPFVTWWKLRKIKHFFDEKGSKMEGKMPPVTVFGSYRKGLRWARANQNQLPDNLNTILKQAILSDRLAIFSLGILIIIAAITVFTKS